MPAPTEPSEETYEEQEETLDQDTTPPTNNSYSSLDEAIMPPPTATDDFKQFQELFKQVAKCLEIPLEEVPQSQHKLLNILQASSTSKIALPINDVLMEPAKNIWQTMTTIPPTRKRSDKKYYVPSKAMDFLFSQPHQTQVIDVTNQRGS